MDRFYKVSDVEMPKDFNVDLLKCPESDRGRILELSKKLIPLCEVENVGVSTISSIHDIFSYSYLSITSRFEKVDPETLEEVGRFWTFHNSDRYGSFYPSVSEILRQIPEEKIVESEYFICLGPVRTLEKGWELFSLGQTILLRSISPKIVVES